MDTSKLQTLAMSETGFIFDPSSGNSFNTNKTGLFIVKLLKEGKSVPEIVDGLCERFDIARDLGEQDILQTIETLRSYYLI